MIKLNDDSIIVGQIKQLLHNYNLPRCYPNNPVIKDYDFNGKHFHYDLSDYIINSYILDKGNLYFDKYQIIEQDYEKIEKRELQKIEYFVENKKYLNLTTNLNINSKYYDEYTHKYLGDYLRWIRDYHNINLMSMYNCSMKKAINTDIIVGNPKSIYARDYITWSCKDNDLFIIPIKYGNEYTIYVEDVAEAICCYYDEENSTQLFPFLTYYDSDILSNMITKYSLTDIYCQDIEHPFLYSFSKYPVNYTSNSTSLDVWKELALTVDFDLKLIIKLPKGYQGKLVVLEGDYTKFSNYQFNLQNNNWKDMNIIPYITKPQLLSNDNYDDFLLADKLIEYLTSNAITNISESYDIEKLQRWFYDNKNQLKENKNINIILDNTYKGIWSQEMTYNLIQLYYYYISQPENKYKKYYDFIGYLDSDMEYILEQYGKIQLYNYGGIV